MNQHDAIKLFDEKQVRTLWNEEKEEWYVSIIDVIFILADSKDYQTARKYWNKLKQRLNEEGNQTVTNCHQLKMKASDGKMRLTDVATTEQLFRLIQSIPSPKAEPFKLWLAKTMVVFMKLGCTPKITKPSKSIGIDSKILRSFRIKRKSRWKISAAFPPNY